MFEKAAQVGILGAIAIGIVATFVFLTVASVIDVPGIRVFDSQQLIGTTVTLTAALGGAAATKFGGSNKGGSGDV